MTNEVQLINKTEKMIDEIKSVCANYGLSGASSEYKIITEIFLYKYLNDKFLCEIKRLSDNLNKSATMKDVEKYLNNLSAEDYSLLIMQKNPNVAKIRKEYLVSYLFNNQNSTTPEFYELFDNALEGISNDNIGIFSVKTGSKDTIKLFESLSKNIPESNKKNAFFRAIISKLVEFSFEEAFDEKYDFFSTVFEYLIKDYNKDFGKYAEYYTPNSIARIIARIMVPEKVQNVTVYDPAAGSGTLILALAHQIGEENCTIYTQDISQKSSELLRLNLILNNLVHSLGNVIHGDTLLNPSHLNDQKNGLKLFDYIVSNPPFKMDFSETRDQLADDKFKERFFAGVPKILKQKKDSMAIYLMFIQHIIHSLNQNGKAAIVVPTGFLSAKNGIEKKIKEFLTNNKYIRGVISMPSNIFATTGTNVSVLFIDKSTKNEKILLMDATGLGIKVKEGKNQRTNLTQQEIDDIVYSFNNRVIKKNFQVEVSLEDIVSNSFSLKPGEYFNPEMMYYNINSNVFSDNKTEYLYDVEKYYELQELNKLATKKFINSINAINIETEYNNLIKTFIPKGWSVYKLSDCIKHINTGLNPRNNFKLGHGNIKYITVKNLTLNGTIDFSNCDTIDENAFNLVHKRSDISKGDILFASISPLGRAYLIEENPKGWDINESVFAIRPNTNIISPEFLYLFLTSEYFVSNAESSSTGSIFNGIRINTLLNIYIALPDKKTMNLYTNSLKEIFKYRDLINKQNEKLDKMNKDLYPLFINGQVTINE